MDTSKIQGYAEMTAEEKVAALESLEIDTDETTKLKNLLNKASSEAADYKRQLKEKMSEQERAEAEARERAEKVEQELTELRREKEISTYKAEYLAIGYDEELALSSAEAMATGNTAKVFENQKIFNEKKVAEHKADLINAQPPLTQGGTTGVSPVTKQDILNITDRKERLKQIEEHKELFF